MKNKRVAWNKGKKGYYTASVETREKISAALMGRKHSPETRKKISLANTGHKGTFTGRRHSEDTKRRISESQKGEKGHWWGKRGENSHRWIADRSQLKVAEDRRTTAYVVWRKLVKDRDGWRCRMASEVCMGDLTAHHILPWRLHPELRYEINNGIALCRYHHPVKYKDEQSMAQHFTELIRT